MDVILVPERVVVYQGLFRSKNLIVFYKDVGGTWSCLGTPSTKRRFTLIVLDGTLQRHS